MSCRSCIVGLALAALLPGCYKYVPVDGAAPVVGEAVALEITDQGRVALADRLGPGVLRIEGRIVGEEGPQLLISVAKVAQINGQVSLWSGETMRLDRSLVGRTQARELDRTRTWLAAAGATAVVAGLIAIADLGGFFDGGRPPEEPPPTTSIRPHVSSLPSPAIPGGFRP